MQVVRFARHDGRERVHAFDAMPFFVHREEQKAAHRRQLEIGAAVFGNRDGTDQPLDGERAAGGHFGHRAGIVDRLGQHLVDRADS